MVKCIIAIVAILCLVSLPNPTVASQKKLWPMPSDLANHNGKFDDSKLAWACSESSDPNAPPSPPGSFPTIPNIPGIPQIPIPNIPQIPIPQIPNIPIPQFPGIPNIPIPQIPIPNIPIPQIPGIPNIPIPQFTIPNIPIPQITLPNLPGLGGGSFGPYQSVLVSQSGEFKKCLSGDKSKVAEKCFSQVFSSWAESDMALDKECCEIVVNMDKKCNAHFHMTFKSHFFAPLLQYSCHIKHGKKN